MRLAQTITVKINGKVLELRPTLRAAVLLERAHGLENLGTKIMDLHTGAIADTIAACAYGPWAAEEIIALMLPGGIVAETIRLAPDLLDLLEGLVGIDPDADEPEEKPASLSAPVTIAEAQRTLYRVATGKLGWTPSEAWNAGPLEILEAWHGRRELLREIFGGTDDKPAAKAASLDDKFAALIARNATLPGAKAA